MKDTYYFTHDYNAQDDDKMLELRAEMGWEGYGLYWAIIERLRANDGYQSPMSGMRGLAMRLNITKDKLQQFFDIAFEVGLLSLDDDGENYYSESLKNRMEAWDNKRKKKVEAGRKGGLAKAKAKQKSSTAKAKGLALLKHCRSIALAIREEKRRKEKRREKKRIFLPPISPKGDNLPKKETQKQKDLKKSMGFLENAFTKTFNGNVPSTDHEVYGNLWSLVIEHQELKQTMNAKNVFKAQRGATSYISSLIKYAQGDIQRAEKVVIQSIENQWIKLVELKEDKTYGKESNEDYRERMYAFADERTRQNLNAIMANQGDGNGAGETSAQAGSKTDWESLID